MSKRFFRHGELHLVILSLLDERPMHGYELMTELARRLDGRYRPSAGSIYPAVQALEAEGLIEAGESDERRVYRLTGPGTQALARRVDQLALIEVRTGTRLRAGGTIDAALERLTARVRAVAGRVDETAVEDVLEQAAGSIEKLASGRN